MKIKELEKFIKESVDELIKTDDSRTFYKDLDNNFSIYVGWEDGFDINDEYAIHSQKQPSYCICFKIAENVSMPFWENAYMPWFVDDEEVYDTDCSVSKNEDYNKVAKYLLSDYRKMKKLLKEGKITFGH